MRTAVILPAAGQSTRFQNPTIGGFVSKLDADLGGKPVLQRTVELFHTRDEVHAIIVAGPADPDAFREFKLRHADRLSLFGATLCQGGEHHRSETVRAALIHVPMDCTHIAVHDAARPCTPIDLIDRVFDAARKHPAVVPAIPVDDTVKRVGEPIEDDTEIDPIAAILGEGAKPPALRPIRETLDRTGLMLIQTPQVFDADLFRRAYATDAIGTDDASIIEALGETVLVIDGDRRNIKITRPDDVSVVCAFLGLNGSGARPTHKRF
jgi:2-C-methyl-D-erythritol 4-phosphate cytidylyltransferase